jgi:hypothetical protein
MAKCSSAEVKLNFSTAKYRSASNAQMKKNERMRERRRFEQPVRSPVLHDKLEGAWLPAFPTSKNIGKSAAKMAF